MMYFFVGMFCIYCYVHCTIDLNLAELQYLADHLHAEECRRLVASLHFKSYEQPNALDQAEGKVSKDIPCIRLLLHWNSAVGEGRGETHETVQHRLRQMGRVDLADWLGKTVFHELGEEMERSLDDPFKELISSTEKEKHTIQPTLVPAIEMWNPTEWIAFDTICWVVLAGLTLFTLVILGKVVFMLSINKKRRKKKRNYRELENENSEETDSEDRFDIRNHQSDLKLHKFSQPSLQRYKP